MTDRKPCIRCGRAIDAWAGICPFCNWSQTAPPPAPGAAPRVSAVQYKPPEEMDVRRLIGIAGGAVLSLILAFLIGMVINSDGAPARAPETVEEQAAEHNSKNLQPKRADTPLIPAGQGGIENEPITSAPVAVAPGQVPDEYQRSDATAVSADEYAQMAKRAQAEKKKKMATLVDPRSISGSAYNQGRPPLPPPQTSASAQTSASMQPRADDAPVARRARRTVRTRPVPQYQPIPALSGSGKARFTLVIGTDGRVKDVNVEQMLRGGNNAALLGAIQSWRFKPATENGEPVAAPYSVEISLERE
ncbi:MAG TPA: energy transducer TonB [Thermoanaerobaculia bacterium]|nr:energy transducer TonB [Thermoanaerobaculia bacterium]